MKINVEINNLTKRAVSKRFIKEIAEFTIKGEEKKVKNGIKEIELSVVFTGLKKIAAINKKFRQIDVPTDVLSFEGDCQSGKTGSFCHLGELFICLPQVAKDALETGIAVNDELAWVVIHGILHLLGYDHEIDEESAKEMRDKEKYYLRKILNSKH